MFGLFRSRNYWYFAADQKETYEQRRIYVLVMAASIINALGCDLVLAGLQRYMTYTLGMTWIGLFLLVRPLWDRTNKGNLTEEEKL